MTVRLKLAIVCDQLHEDKIELIAPLQHLYQTTLFCASGGNKLQSPFQVIELEEHHELEGILVELEDHLSSMDLVLILDVSKIYSFQAAEITQKHNLTLLALYYEPIAQYFEKYPSIQKYRDKTLKQVDLFLNLTVSSTLQLSNYPLQDPPIFTINPELNSLKKPEPLHRFRHLLKLPEDCEVMFLEERNPTPVLLGSILKSIQFLSAFKDYRLIVHCKKESADELKHAALYSGLGENIMFLHESNRQVLFDAMCSSQYYLHHADVTPQGYPDWELGILMALKASCIPILSPTHCFATEINTIVKQPEKYEETYITKCILAIEDQSLAQNKLKQFNDSHQKWPEVFLGINETHKKKQEKNLQTQPENSPSVQLGYDFYHQQQYAQAYDCFKKCLAHAPHDTKALLGMSLIYFHTDDFQLAFYWLEEVLKREVSAKHLQFYVVLCYKLENPAMALKRLASLEQLVGPQNILSEAQHLIAQDPDGR